MNQLQAAGPGEIRIDREGCWFFCGAPIVNPAILELFNASIEPDGRGGYRLSIDGETNPLVVEDTPYVVTHIEAEAACDGAIGSFIIRLSDGSRETLLLDTLFLSPENIPYCTVKGGRFPARFLRSPYYDLASHILQDGDIFYIPVAGGRQLIEIRER